MPPATAHHFTVDVEEHFHANALDPVVGRPRWEAQESRVVSSTSRLLDALGRRGATATFFVLGWVAERHPALVRRIANEGHEVASHGYWHRRVVTLRPAEFRDDVRRARDVLEAITGQAVVGYRAPSFSICHGYEWAFDVLIEEGYRYDSSLFPIRRPGYGYAGAPTTPHEIHRPAGTIVEYPLATFALAGLRLPGAGGAYLRHLPFSLVRGTLRQHDRAGRAAVFYVHPWEVDEGQPRLPVSRLTALRHYGGLARTMPRIERLLDEFAFRAIRDVRSASTEHADRSRVTAPRVALAGAVTVDRAISATP